VNLMRLSLLKAAHVVVGECRASGNPGRPSSSAQVRLGEPGAPVLLLLGSARAQALPGRNSELVVLTQTLKAVPFRKITFQQPVKRPLATTIAVDALGM
jgi:hypothetical protein